ncbi:MAG: hypothetical protein RR552_07880 [Oscillospiraceae bacterium]
MAEFSWVIQLILFLSSGIAFACGVAQFFKKGIPLFTQIVICGLGCMMLGWLFSVVILLTNGHIPDGFHVGKLGLAGGFLFLFSASFGQMNGLVDGGEKTYRKYRVLSLLAPIVILAIYILSLFSTASIEVKCVDGVLCLVFALSSYYNLKHLIIPDVDFGILKSIRGYNFLALLLSILSAINLIAMDQKWYIISWVASILCAVTYIAIIPVLAKGAKKWTI